jgi:hypothetical protein
MQRPFTRFIFSRNVRAAVAHLHAPAAAANRDSNSKKRIAALPLIGPTVLMQSHDFQAPDHSHFVPLCVLPGVLCFTRAFDPLQHNSQPTSPTLEHFDMPAGRAQHVGGEQSAERARR